MWNLIKKTFKLCFLKIEVKDLNNHQRFKRFAVNHLLNVIQALHWTSKIKFYLFLNIVRTMCDIKIFNCFEKKKLRLKSIKTFMTNKIPTKDYSSLKSPFVNSKSPAKLQKMSASTERLKRSLVINQVYSKLKSLLFLLL